MAQPNTRPTTTHTIMLTGTVSDSSGTPLSGASVELLNYNQSVKKHSDTPYAIASTSSTLDGSYSLPIEVGPDNTFPEGIRAGKPGCASIYLVLYELHSPHFKNATEINKPIVLSTGTTVTGRVGNFDGTPKPQVPILAQSDQRVKEGVIYWPTQTHTDADGNFVLSDIPSGKLKVMAMLAEGGSLQKVITAPAKDIILTAAAANGAIKGKVIQLETGTGVAGATVTLQRRFVEGNGWRADPGFKEETHTGTDGDFWFKELRPGVYGTYIAANGLSLLDSTESASGLELSAGETGHIHATLFTGTEVFGTVIDAVTSTPIPGVQISVADVTGLPAQRTTITVTDSNGHFSLKPVPIDRHRLEPKAIVRIQVKANGYVLQQSKSDFGAPDSLTVEFLRTQPRVQKSIKMQKAHWVAGVVKASNGKPISGASIYVNPVAEPGSRRIRSHRANLVSKTDARGQFSVNLENLKTQSIYATAEGFAIGVASNINPQAPVKIQILPSATLRGLVMGEDNHPIEGAEVTAIPIDSVPIQTTSRHDLTAADGTFEIVNVLPGRQRINVQKPGYIRGEPTELSLKPGDNVSTVTVHLTRGLSVSGRVLDETGNAVAGVRIIACAHQQAGPPGKPRPHSSSMGFPLAMTQSGLDGKFVLEGLPNKAIDIGIRTRGMPEIIKSNVQPGVTNIELRIPKANP